MAQNGLADAPPPPSALPLASGPAPDFRPAPVATALPPAPSAPLGAPPQGDQYAYLDQAYNFSQSLAESPPDYGYTYQGEQPWVWQSSDGSYRVGERLPTGMRFFYYAPGASTPYLIQDPRYSYAFSRGYLAAVYGPNGALAPTDVAARQAREAGAYLAWAAGLYAAARHERHMAVAEARWNDARRAVYADQARWAAARQRNEAWARYSDAHQDDQAHWAAQRYVRAAEAARFAQAVHDQTALAHAQQAIVEARSIAESHGQRLPGPQPRNDVASREVDEGRRSGPEPAAKAPHPEGLQHPSPASDARRSLAAPPAASATARPLFQPHDQATSSPGAGRPVSGAEALRQAQRQPASADAARQRAQQEMLAAASRRAQAQGHGAQAHEQPFIGRQPQAADADHRAAADRPQADAHRQSADRAVAEANRNAALASQSRKAAEAEAHARPPPSPPRPAAPPSKPKPKPEETSGPPKP